MHRKRIACGAAWLDKEDPGWHTRVNPDILDPDSDKHCVLGQVFGDFDKWISRRYLLPADREPSKLDLLLFLHPGLLLAMHFCHRRGFMQGRETVRQWREAWREEIESRRPLYVPTGWSADIEKYVNN